jgi:hypothetical protein
MPTGTLRAPVDQDRLLVAAFRSPVTASAFHGYHSGVNVPSLLLRYLFARFHCPFGFSAPPPHRFAPECGDFVASIPFQRKRSNRTAAPAISTSLQDIYILPDQSVQSLSLPFGPPSEFARFPLAPQHLSITSGGAGSSFQVRYVFGGSLFLKPLGTSFNMRRSSFCVNGFRVAFAGFSTRLYVYCFEQVTYLS